MPPNPIPPARILSQKPFPVVLTADEEVTLRRVAHGHTEVRLMRPADLARLRRLALIEEGRDGPRLTVAGRGCFDALSHSVLAPSPRHADFQASAAVSPPDETADSSVASSLPRRRR